MRHLLVRVPPLLCFTNLRTFLITFPRQIFTVLETGPYGVPLHRLISLVRCEKWIYHVGGRQKE